MSTTCALCQRVFSEPIADPQAIQEHHLRPEARATSPTVTLCRPCHDNVHARFTNEELRADYDTIEALRTADRLREYVEWIRGTETLRVQTTTSNRVRETRR